MLKNSTKTALGIKGEVASHFSESVSDADIRLALNWFYSLVWRAVRTNRPSSASNLTDATPIPTDGFELSSIGDLGTVSHGFSVYEGSVSPSNRLDEVPFDSKCKGYYILGDKLFVINSGDVVIKYFLKTPRLLDNEQLKDHFIQIDQDLEQTLFRFCSEVFYEGEFQEDRAIRQEDRFLEELDRFFDVQVVSRALRI